jgi:hypothetical protein
MRSTEAPAYRRTGQVSDTEIHTHVRTYSTILGNPTNIAELLEVVAELREAGFSDTDPVSVGQTVAACPVRAEKSLR